jgi:hypothetical protein
MFTQTPSYASYLCCCLQTLYFLTSFFNQFGPNCTTFLVAGEVFPTDIRAFFHGK